MRVKSASMPTVALEITTLQCRLKKTGFTVTDWAKGASVSRSTIYRIAEGEISPNIETFLRLVRVANQALATPQKEKCCTDGTD
jgi:predicted transcriptional regulator